MFRHCSTAMQHLEHLDPLLLLLLLLLPLLLLLLHLGQPPLRGCRGRSPTWVRRGSRGLFFQRSVHANGTTPARSCVTQRACEFTRTNLLTADAMHFRRTHCSSAALVYATHQLETARCTGDTRTSHQVRFLAALQTCSLNRTRNRT